MMKSEAIAAWPENQAMADADKIRLCIHCVDHERPRHGAGLCMSLDRVDQHGQRYVARSHQARQDPKDPCGPEGNLFREIPKQ